MGPVNSLPPELSSSNSQPNQTCPTSISQPYQTSTTSITEQVKSEKTAQPSPSIHTPTTVTSTSTPSREEEEDEESSPSTNMMMIKKYATYITMPTLSVYNDCIFLLHYRCQLTPQHCLHVLRHSNRAYVLSPQVSRWFWDTDLLQSMLRQVCILPGHIGELEHGLTCVCVSRYTIPDKCGVFSYKAIELMISLGK